MTTEVTGAVPIPELTVQGTGAYIIPADRYGFINANTVSQATGWTGFSASDYNASSTSTMGDSPLAGQSSSASANHAHNFLVEGDSITVANTQTDSSSSSAGSLNSHHFANRSDGKAQVLVNGVSFCQAMSGGSANHSRDIVSITAAGVRVRSESSWSVAVYRIPKGNLPAGTAEGET